ncbi:MAG: lysophospholipid acyltransferase family protein [Gemmatimonadota bacterium]
MTDREAALRRAWLLPGVGRLSRAAVRIFYRFAAEGRAPEDGPVLLVANHPNSLVDPILVAAVAGRPVRFLAKAPLFEERLVGPLVRAAGSIPVYRAQDDPALMERNASVFEAVHEALAAGAAVGIFPEGISHSEPSLARLRTGAARIALGALERRGVAVPIVPVGIVLRQKERFRSEALALVGPPVSWTDLEGRAESDADAVRELTSRIESALRDVTVNLERIEDRPVVECAEAIYAARLGLEASPEDRVRRLRQASEMLQRLRRDDPARLAGLFSRVKGFADSLTILGLAPDELAATPRPRAAVGWTIRALLYFLIGGPIAAAGHVVFFVPYQAVDRVAMRPGVPDDVRSTWKLLGGAALYLGWCVMLALAVGAWLGVRAGLAAVVGLPVLALVTLAVRERWRDSREALRRYLVLRRSGAVRQRLLARREELGIELEALRREFVGDRGDRTRA